MRIRAPPKRAGHSAAGRRRALLTIPVGRFPRNDTFVPATARLRRLIRSSIPRPGGRRYAALCHAQVPALSLRRALEDHLFRTRSHVSATAESYPRGAGPACEVLQYFAARLASQPRCIAVLGGNASLGTQPILMCSERQPFHALGCLVCGLVARAPPRGRPRAIFCFDRLNGSMAVVVILLSPIWKTCD